MAKEKLGEIRINRRTLRIGHQVYPLANISRVQTLRESWRGRRATWYPIWQIAVVGLLASGVSYGSELVPGLNRTMERAVQYWVLVLAGILVIYFVGVLLYRLLLRRARSVLVIETAGTQYAALSGTDHQEVLRIEGLIVDAIEDPPNSEQTYQIYGDIVAGDKIDQSGAGNTLTVNH
jgi:hypothetical protein